MNRMLTQDQITAFERDGFIVVRGFFDAGEMAAIRDWTDTVQGWEEQPGRQMMYFELADDGRRLLNRMENFVPYHGGLGRIAQDGQVPAAVGQLLGEPAVLFKDKINFKLPGGGGFEAHQDAQAGWSKYAQLHLTVLVAIDAMSAENGCLEMGPRRATDLIGKEWVPLAENQVAGIRFEPIPAEPGDVVFFDSFAPHRSAPNRSQAPRRVLYLTYNKSSEGDRRAQYFADKRASYPPDVEREAGKEYRYRV